MQITNHKILLLSEKIQNKERIKIAILGLGSVGNYLLNYLLSMDYKQVEIIIAGRNLEKIEQDINIASVSTIIRNNKHPKITIKKVDFSNTDSITSFFKENQPDIVVNSTRSYSGIKYGSISWHTIRAYGLWAPLSINVIKNIMLAHSESNSNAIIINTSYADVVNPWLKSTNLPYPDFGSGNLNHLIPRIKLAVKKELNLSNDDNINVTLATSHYHDVVISREGHTENIDPLINISINNKNKELDYKKIYKIASISMPTDHKRNMMNASSNFEIINKILSALEHKKSFVFHSPGAFGEIGGYPIKIDANNYNISFYEKHFPFTEMEKHNKKSIYLDGIEKIENQSLFYTDELIGKVKASFDLELPKNIHFDDIEGFSEFLIENIIKAHS